MYGTLHGTYKKALRKALQTKSSSLHLIKILEDFANEDNEFESEDEELGEKESDNSDKENINVVQLQNSKLKRGKGRLVGTK
ncbi:18881_t:CDS:1, partial [Rhizophagus irregularis]